MWDIIRALISLKMANEKTGRPGAIMNVDKAVANYFKHGVSFYEAAPLISSTKTIVESDPCVFEERYRLIGKSHKGRFLQVVFTKRYDNWVTRIISARKASSKEKKKLFTTFPELE